MSGSFQFPMSSKDFNPQTIEMDMKEEMSSTENDSGEEFTCEESTLNVHEIDIKIKHEEVDYNLHHKLTPDYHTEDQSEFDLETMYSIAHAECESIEAEEQDLNDFYHDILLCKRDCGTCVKYMRMFSEHVRTTHSPPQPIQDPLLIDAVPVSLNGQSSSSIQIKSEVDGNIVKMELDCNDKENKSGDEFIHETETTYIVDKFEIKHEEMDFHLHDNSTAEVHSEGHSHSSIEQLSSSAHFERGSTKAEMDLNHFYNDLLLCERDCETCIKYMRMLSEHVRTTHAPPQPIQYPLLIDTVTLTEQSSSSIQIKSEVDENIVKMELDCSDHEEVPVPNSDSDPDYNLECDSESNPDYAPSPALTKKLRRQGQGLAANHASSRTRSLKPKKENLTLPYFKCENCDKSFKRKFLLRQHMRVHTGEKPYKCNVCEKRFARSSALTEHKRVHTGERPYKCNACEMRFKSSTHLNGHKRIHTEGRPFKCDVCEKSFARYGDLTEHKRVHTGGKPFQCDVCEKRFARSSALTAHRRFHTGEKPFKCVACEMSFARNCDLTVHMRIHTGIKPFLCDTCGKSFIRSCELTAHMKCHTGEKPFNCDVCEKSFARNGDLTVHRRIHTGENAFQCETSFTRLTQLTAHKSFHTGDKPYKCDACDRKFARNSDLTVHMRIHTGIKPFQCDACGKSFRRSAELTIHMRLHTGEKPFKCDLCEKSFTKSTYSTTHKRVHIEAKQRKHAGQEQTSVSSV